MDTLTLSQVTGPDAAIEALLQAHFDLMRATSPAESCHVMEPVTVFKDATVVLTAHEADTCLLYTSPSPRDRQKSRMPSSA